MSVEGKTVESSRRGVLKNRGSQFSIKAVKTGVKRTRSEEAADQAEVKRAALMMEGRTGIPESVMAITKGCEAQTVSNRSTTQVYNGGRRENEGAEEGGRECEEDDSPKR